MILTIFGATGKTGKQLVKQAIYLGHYVKAFGRNVFTAGFREDDNLKLLPGAVFDDDRVLEVIQGSDVVLSALGGASDGSDKTRSLGMKKITEQMEKAGVKRIIAVGGMGVLNAGNGKLIMENPDYPAKYLPVGQEHLKAFQILKESDLDWTFVACPDLVDHEVTGEYHVAASEMPEHNTYKINTGDLALFMLTEMERNQFVKQKVGISN